MIVLSLLLAFSDPSFGKVDKHSLSQQTLLELLIEGLRDTSLICGSNDRSTDMSEWKGLSINGAYEITRIDWRFMDLLGSIELKWLPISSKDVNFSWNELVGTVDLTCLPDGLEVLDIGGNKFEGIVDLTKLPPGLKRLYLNNNGFHGMCDFGQLPQSLKMLNVRDTQLEGEIILYGGHLVAKESNVKDMR